MFLYFSYILLYIMNMHVSRKLPYSTFFCRLTNSIRSLNSSIGSGPVSLSQPQVDLLSNASGSILVKYSCLAQLHGCVDKYSGKSGILGYSLSSINCILAQNAGASRISKQALLANSNPTISASVSSFRLYGNSNRRIEIFHF